MWAGTEEFRVRDHLIQYQGFVDNADQTTVEQNSLAMMWARGGSTRIWLQSIAVAFAEHAVQALRGTQDQEMQARQGQEEAENEKRFTVLHSIRILREAGD